MYRNRLWFKHDSSNKTNSPIRKCHKEELMLIHIVHRHCLLRAIHTYFLKKFQSFSSSVLVPNIPFYFSKEKFQYFQKDENILYICIFEAIFKQFLLHLLILFSGVFILSNLDENFFLKDYRPAYLLVFWTFMKAFIAVYPCDQGVYKHEKILSLCYLQQAKNS